MSDNKEIGSLTNGNTEGHGGEVNATVNNRENGNKNTGIINRENILDQIGEQDKQIGSNIDEEVMTLHADSSVTPSRTMEEDPLTSATGTGNSDEPGAEEMIPFPSSQILRNRQSNSSPTRSPLLNNNQTNISLSQTSTAEFIDPLFLTGLKKTEEELEEMGKAGADKRLIKFYKSQNELIERLTAPLTALNEDEIRSQNIKLKIAVYGSAAVNIILFALQLTAALLSGSLSLFATTADAFMDLLSSGILMVTTYMAGKREIYRYPAGKGRFETAGIIVFASLMATLSLQLILKAIESLTGTPESPDLGILSISFVAVALAAKLCLFLYCRVLTEQPAAQVLAQDHRNDLFVNGFGLTLGILGEQVNPLIDPIGALVVALIILRSWSITVLEQCQLIVGKSADPTFLKKVIYIAMTHDERILQVDTCRVYHAGSKVIAEVDIVLPPETSLQVSHDVGETLQIKLESLPNVDRAFVHCDYEATHTPEHQKWV